MSAIHFFVFYTFNVFIVEKIYSLFVHYFILFRTEHTRFPYKYDNKFIYPFELLNLEHTNDLIKSNDIKFNNKLLRFL